MFATIDNSVVLPAYTRVDAAGFVRLTQQLRVQVNVENLFDKTSCNTATPIATRTFPSGSLGPFVSVFRRTSREDPRATTRRPLTPQGHRDWERDGRHATRIAHG